MKKILKIFIIILLIPIILILGMLLFFTVLPQTSISEIGKNFAKMPIEKEYFTEKNAVKMEKIATSLWSKEEYTLFYPAGTKTSNTKYPLILAVNGTGWPVEKYKNVLTHIASHGYIVM